MPLTVFVITNVLKAAEEKMQGGIEAVYTSEFCHRKRLPSSYISKTPTKILSIKEPKSTGIRAVAIIEHRNIKAQMDWMKDSIYRIVIVIVSHIIVNTYLY